MVAAPAAIFSQVSVSDTSYLEYENKHFFNVQVITYDDGSSERHRRFICDSSKVYRYFNSEVLAWSLSTANAVRESNRINFEVGAMRSKLLYIASASGVSVLDSFMRDYTSNLLSQSWEIRHAGQAQAITFTQTAQGAGRYSVGASTVRQFQALGKDIIWLINYPDGLNQGSVLRLYRVNPNRYESIGRTYIMSRTGQGSQGKTAAPAPVIDVQIEDVKPAQPKRKKQ